MHKSDKMGNTASNTSRGVPNQNVYSRRQQYSHQESTDLVYPSVSEFTDSPSSYPRFVLATVLSTGKMQVMTREEAYGNRNIKIVSNPSNDSPTETGFFAQPSPNVSSFQGHLQYGRDIQMEYALALDLFTGSFEVVRMSCILREPWRYQVFQNL